MTGEIFDKHGAYTFDAYIDTGSIFGLVLEKNLADAVCAQIEKEVNVSIGAGSKNIVGQIRKVNLQFGGLSVKNYPAVVVDGDRNLIGVKFFQDAGIAIVFDFLKGKTMGGFVTTDRKLIKAVGKTSHCFLSHNTDITKTYESCPICGERWE